MLDLVSRLAPITKRRAAIPSSLFMLQLCKFARIIATSTSEIKWIKMAHSLRYRRARNVADSLGQVFTPTAIANLLLDTMNTSGRSISLIVDLGAGLGALSAVALERHPDSCALLVELDQTHAGRLAGVMPTGAVISNEDVLSTRWSKEGLVADMVISNPPYGMIATSDSIEKLIGSSGLPISVSAGWIPGDVAFLARGWRCSTRESVFGYIVACPIVRDPNFLQLRRVLVGQLRGLCVTQLDTNSFPGAEVQAFLITGTRSVKRNRKVLLRKASADGRVVGEIEVGHDEAITRLDFDYHSSMKKLGIAISRYRDTLSSTGASVVRGSRSRNEFQQLGLSAFHTTDFRGFSGEFPLMEFDRRLKIASPGDILIPRVGSRCLVNQIKVAKGNGYFTDCVYRISTSIESRERVWRTLNSPFGAEWRLANASGNCAKHLTVATLMDMPLIS